VIQTVKMVVCEQKIVTHVLILSVLSVLHGKTVQNVKKMLALIRMEIVFAIVGTFITSMKTFVKSVGKPVQVVMTMIS
jgi:hypothetical protein